jgi:hypothetical protein
MSIAKRSGGLFMSACASVMLGACGMENSTVVRPVGVGNSRGLVTTGDVRVVMANGLVNGSDHGHAVPSQIVCAEPSPDLAKAVSAALSKGGALAVEAESPNVPVKGDLQATVASSRSRAESIAQLTNRLATIQLLRDGLYRACEAYANGAISDTTYAVMLSRIDKMMVTMLLGELTAGNIGQSLATLGSSAHGSATSSLVAQLQNAQDEADAAKADLAKKEADLSETDAELKDASADPEAKDEQETLEKQKKTDTEAVGKAKDTVEKTQRNLRAAARSAASAGETHAVGSLSARSDVAVKAPADALQNMQDKYLTNINWDPLLVACISAMDRRDRDGIGDNGLVDLCRTNIPALVQGQQEILNAIVGRKAEEKADRDLGRAVGRINNARAKLKSLTASPAKY